MPTQEQTWPKTTETSNPYEKKLFSISPAKTSLRKINRCKLMTKPRRFCGKSHPATPTQEQTRPISTETSNLDKKICCFWYLLRKRALSKQNIANWWPNRADMVGNLISRPQLRSRREQWRRKLAIFTKKELFLISPAKTSLEKTKVASWWPNRGDMMEISSRDANSGANETNIDGN